MTRSTNDEQCVERIRTAGWRQGAVVRIADAQRLSEDVSGYEISSTEDSDWWIVLTHDCDVVSRDLTKEPWIEVLAARPHKGRKADSTLAHGRNPRKLHFEARDDDCDVILSANVHDRFRFPRGLLAEISPDSGRSLSRESCRLLCQWIAKRYIRPAFPDCFNRRLKSQGRKIGRFFEQNAALLSAVYIAINPEEELERGRDYRCAVTLVCPSAIRDFDALEKMRDEFESVLSACSGIEIAGIRALNEQEFTLADLRELKRLDLDFLSASEDSPAPPDASDIQ